jgi:hypothetical protein
MVMPYADVHGVILTPTSVAGGYYQKTTSAAAAVALQRWLVTLSKAFASHDGSRK